MRCSRNPPKSVFAGQEATGAFWRRHRTGTVQQRQKPGKPQFLQPVHQQHIWGFSLSGFWLYRTPLSIQTESRLAMTLERETGFEPATSTLARSHSTAELLPLVLLILQHLRISCQSTAAAGSGSVWRGDAALTSRVRGERYRAVTAQSGSVAQPLPGQPLLLPVGRTARHADQSQWFSRDDAHPRRLACRPDKKFPP